MVNKIAVVEFGGSGVKMTVFKFDSGKQGYEEDEDKITDMGGINRKLDDSEISYFTVIASSGFIVNVNTHEHFLQDIVKLKGREKFLEIKDNPLNISTPIKDKLLEFGKFEGMCEATSYNVNSHFHEQYCYMSMGSTTVQCCNVDGENVTVEACIEIMDGDNLNEDLTVLLEKKVEGKLVLAGNFTASIFHPSEGNKPQEKMKEFFIKGTEHDKKISDIFKGKKFRIEQNDKMYFKKDPKDKTKVQEGYKIIKEEAKGYGFNLEETEKPVSTESIILTKTNKGKGKISFSEGAKPKLLESIAKRLYEEAKRLYEEKKVGRFFPSFEEYLGIKICNPIKIRYGEDIETKHLLHPNIIFYTNKILENPDNDKENEDYFTKIKNRYLEEKGLTGGGKRSRRRVSKKNKSRKNRNKSKPKSKSKSKNRVKKSRGKKSKRSRR